jgi:hypothetical protein
MGPRRRWAVGTIPAATAILLAGSYLAAAHSATLTSRQHQDGSAPVDQQHAGPDFRWSPDHKTLARIDVAQLIGTPQGSNSCLYLGARAVYPVVHPKDCQPHPKGIYDGIHTFLSPPEWSPDSRRVAIVVRIFDWEYTDPFGRYWEGTLSKDRYYLAIASLDQLTVGYPLKSPVTNPKLAWLTNSRLTLDGQTFDLDAEPPGSIP